MTTELEQLLANLTAVNDKMAEHTNTPGMSLHNAALMHTLQRHRDILQDYTHEFHKTKSNFFSLREREDLLGSVHRDIESYKSGTGVNNRRTELFLKEHEHLRNSDSLIDSAISIAMATKENITFQRGMLKSIQTRVTTLANRFPTINSLIQKINLRKRRDSLILGGVIGVCTILLLLYTFHWFADRLTDSHFCSEHKEIFIVSQDFLKKFSYCNLLSLRKDFILKRKIYLIKNKVLIEIVSSVRLESLFIFWIIITFPLWDLYIAAYILL